MVGAPGGAVHALQNDNRSMAIAAVELCTVSAAVVAAPGPGRAERAATVAADGAGQDRERGPFADPFGNLT